MTLFAKVIRSCCSFLKVRFRRPTVPTLHTKVNKKNQQKTKSTLRVCPRSNPVVYCNWIKRHHPRQIKQKTSDTSFNGFVPALMFIPLMMLIAHMHTHTHARARTHTVIQTYICIYMYIHTCTHTYMYAYMQIYIHEHTHSISLSHTHTTERKRETKLVERPVDGACVSPRGHV